MLRATVEQERDQVTLRVEGSLSGPGLLELETCWSNLIRSQGQKRIFVDLNEVTFVSREGKQLLQRLRCAGACLSGDGLLIRALLEQMAEHLPEPQS